MKVCIKFTKISRMIYNEYYVLRLCLILKYKLMVFIKSSGIFQKILFCVSSLRIG